MGTYNALVETGEGIVKLLRENLVPEFVKHPEEIELYSPIEKGNAVVSICLYDISKNEDIVGTGMQDCGMTRQKYPPLFLDLYFMITVKVQSDVKFRARQEQRLLGRILQVFAANQILPSEYLSGEVPEYPLKIQMEKLSYDAKTKIYGGVEQSYQTSLFYRVFPVEVESANEKKVVRVTHMGYSVDDEKKR